MASSRVIWCAAGLFGAVVAGAAFIGLASRPPVAEEIETATIKRGDVVTTIEVEGSAESTSNLDIKCRVAGGSTILWIVPDGSLVKAGDELVRFDSSAVEETLSQQTIVVEQARAAQIAAEHELAAARLAVTEYVEGTFVELDETAAVNIATAENNLRLAQQTLASAKRLARRGFITPTQVEPSQFAVSQAELELEVARRAKSVLETYNRPKMTQDLITRRDVAVAQVRATTAEFELAQRRLAHYHEQLEHCVMRAPRGGIAIHANDPGRALGAAPQIELGAFVYERQNIFWIPDLSTMQVQALVHESSVLRVRPGQPASVRVRGRDLPAVVRSVANQPVPIRRSHEHLKFFLISAVINAPSPGLRPGETVDLTLLIKYRPDVLRTPLETVVKAEDGAYVWVDGDEGIEPRRVELGELGDAMAEVRGGLEAGDRVVIRPRDHLPEVDSLFGSPGDRRRQRFGAGSVSSARRLMTVGTAAGG
ncbi:MAG TPA: hypothetical protein VHC22_28290 [Pirellulales bacterium]|nr:hypothetical protein [Pirellulales bacterium]